MLRQLTFRTASTFANQSKLPKLPIPSLNETCSKYLESIKPFLQPSQLELSEKKVQEFQTGLGQTLQKRLLNYAKSQPDNWLEELWLDKAYLSFRDPLLININWWCMFVDSPDRDRLLLHKPPPKGVLSDYQIQRAAGLVNNFLNFKQLLDE